MPPQRTLLFLDTEFTGLERKGELISLAVVAGENHWFYAQGYDWNAIF
ncbi:MAG: hypothetical protein SH848_17645 [Saprospiraceae bacterium]|nr:hypothetical protein [Saprospiraceae bacterium]MDZ4705755.1 hypothetical protein [Saprospiraceae bacterium]